MANKVMVSAFMSLFVGVVQFYTWITLPVYYVLQRPWQKRSKSERLRVKKQSDKFYASNMVQLSFNNKVKPNTSVNVLEINENETEDMTPIFVRDDLEKRHPLLSSSTITEILDIFVEFHGADKQCLGFRQVVSEQDSLDKQGNVRRIDGRQLKQYGLSDYKWLTYGQANAVISSLAQGLLSKGITSDDKVLIISETRVEWMLVAQAIIKTGATIVTLFSNLGVDGVAHGIIETQVNTVISSLDCLPLLKKILIREGHSIKQIVYIDGFHKPNLDGFSDLVEIVALSELEKIGRDLIESDSSKPTFTASADHLLIIMYTSGTTGTPKAALMSHRQFIASMHALFILVKDLIQDAPYHTYISFLPMAHVLELTIEFFFFFGGLKIGYASPFTLTDSAPGLARGQKSDIKLLRPTVITAVPLVLDRILKEINEKLRSRTAISQPVFNYLMQYKSSWTRCGYDCPIVRCLLCSKVREQLGGNLSYMIVGGAPLNANTQATIKAALDLTLIQGYGATETTGAALCMDFDDLEYGCVGTPLGGVKFRLKDWPEASYYSTDKPNPRGEILIGGDIIATGYYKSPRETEEAFFTDRQGIRWFRTGDIGELNSNGTVRIIDRRKDLIKLQNGEYISLGKVEAALKLCKYVDNICVYGGAFSTDIVALVSPNQKAMLDLTQRLNKQHLTPAQQCNDIEFEYEVYNDIVQTAKINNLGKKEIPIRIKLVPDEWSPDNGILTAALKLKRKSIEKRYQDELNKLYDENNLVKVIALDSNNNSKTNNSNINADQSNSLIQPLTNKYELNMADSTVRNETHKPDV